MTIDSTVPSIPTLKTNQPLPTKQVNIDNHSKQFKQLLTQELRTSNNLKKSGLNAQKMLNATEDGTKIAALKSVSKQLTDQFYGFIWAQMASDVDKNTPGGFAEEMFRKSLWPELVKNNNQELDELSQAVFEQLKDQNL